MINIGKTWSYSRLKTFERCKYAYKLRYLAGIKEQERFFSQYGTFIHKLLAEYLNGETEDFELPVKYLCDFKNEVTESAPTEAIFEKYYQDGLNYLNEEKENEFGNIIEVEKKFNFTVGDKDFVGIVDAVRQNEDGSISIIDHKSHRLKPRSTRKKPTLKDKELDEYLRQLYLYANPLREAFDCDIKSLVFNCFRDNIKIEEPFDEQKFKEVNEWAENLIDKIDSTTDWEPEKDVCGEYQINQWGCTQICSYSDICPYYKEKFGKDEKVSTDSKDELT